jgi:hypothetical protein
MKLIGVTRLHALACRAAPLRGAARALHAELAAARWGEEADARAAYPDATLDAGRLVIGLDSTGCAVVAVNYKLGIIVIEFAGDRVDMPAGRPNKGRRT